ncbi:hypothetical protein [Mucilaginibacter sp. L3T2-6]|uniref:hypothetical protein n=1 Tax=Mucilaginibacter sp. L3T2-6 TaxID=3062491 RepID=UPI0026750D26|nr:hypothetical protein [Mucilaginibacter sp. L3T2-6]MDO3643810.1 hypothetical protein [Mucilaginibacter sp. L3T2-6]MDV6216261.1 hypothetical protein [Mucilaginibacter sp. L3T2-6]
MLQFLTLLSVVSGLFPVLAALLNYKHLDKVLKLATAFFLMNVLSDLLQVLTLVLRTKNNQPILHANIILSVLFLIGIYYYSFVFIRLKRFVLSTGLVAVLALIYCLIYINGIWDYPSSANTVLSLLTILFSIIYFVQLLNQQEFVHIERLGFFWINSGLLFYFSVNIFLFMLFKRMIANHLQEYYMIHNVTNIIANILFSVGMLCKPQKSA